MSRNVFEITLLGIIVFRGVKQFAAEFCVYRWLCTPRANGVSPLLTIVISNVQLHIICTELHFCLIESKSV